MKIADSRVAMAASHEKETYVSTKKASVELRAQSGAQAKETVAALYSASGGSMTAALTAYGRRSQTAEASVSRTGSAATRPQEQAAEPTAIVVQPCAVSFELDEASELKIKLLNRLLEALGGKGRIEPVRIGGSGEDALDLRGGEARRAGMHARMFGMSAFRFSASAAFAGFAAAGAATSPAGTLWQRVNAVSEERSERETTAFRSKGLAVTEDGRRIEFNVEFAMSRSFTEKFEALSSEQFILTDPLVIQLDGGAPSVSEVKFSFDLDGDGEREKVSFAGSGSGFLALDRNGNGVIDDGGELFGTKSGDGFADLAAYDGDGNGWIDENDEVYSKLRVWVRDENGADTLLDLKDADVGAIYLGSADTEFTIKSKATNETEAVLRKSGVYLKESGGAGALSHIDLRC